MDFLYITFPVSEVETWVFIPFFVALFISFFTSMAGISGAFILLPFQMSVLNFTSPAVSGTNHFYNIIAIPSGVWRYMKEKRMVWPLTWVVTIGTLPGVWIGAWLRVKYLKNPESFKFFVGVVLLYIGIRLAADVIKKMQSKSESQQEKKDIPMADFIVSDTRFSLKNVEFKFCGDPLSFPVPGALLLCFIVGIIGGIYGIGGGSIIAPFFVTFFHLPVHAVAGAALMATFVTSIAGVVIYQVMALFYPSTPVAPDLLLGALFGFGGLLGMYLGATFQKYVPAHRIKIILCACILFVAIQYIKDFIV